MRNSIENMGVATGSLPRWFRKAAQLCTFLGGCQIFSCQIFEEPFETERGARERFGEVETLLRLVGCDQSAVTMRRGARLTAGKLTLLSRSGPTSWAGDSEYLFWAEFFSLHKSPCSSGLNEAKFRGTGPTPP